MLMPEFTGNEAVYRSNREAYTIHRIEGYISNIFLAEYDQGMLLFDCGAVNDLKRIHEYCRQLDRSPADIKLAVVSHVHPDHSGSAVLLRKKYGIPLAAHKDIDRWYSGIGGSIQQKLDCHMMQIVARSNKRKMERALFKRIISPDFLLDDGDMLPRFSDWQVYHVPGHTLHDMVLFHPRNRLLYASDCILNNKGRYQLPLPVMFPELMRASLNRLAALNPALILVAHGNSINTAQDPDIFSFVQSQLDLPETPLAKQVHRMSVYSPEVRRGYK